MFIYTPCRNFAPHLLIEIWPRLSKLYFGMQTQASTPYFNWEKNHNFGRQFQGAPPLWDTNFQVGEPKTWAILTEFAQNVRTELGLGPRPPHENVETGSIASSSPPGARPPPGPTRVNRSVRCHRCGYLGHLAANCWTDIMGKGKGKGKGKGGKGMGKGFTNDFGQGKGKGQGKGGWNYPTPPPPTPPVAPMGGCINIFMQGAF